MVLAAAASNSGSSPSHSWSLTSLVRTARHRYRAYVGIRIVGLGLTSDGAVYWTAYRQHSDGKTLEVFRWKDGRLSDFGSPGRKLNVVAVNSRGQFAVQTMPPPIRMSETDSGVGRAFLWRNGKMTDLRTLGGRTSSALAIDSRGTQILGGADPPGQALLRTRRS